MLGYEELVLDEPFYSENNTVLNSAPTNLLTTPVSDGANVKRRAVSICNKDATQNLLIVEQIRGAGTPTVSTTTATRVVVPLATVILPYNWNIELWGQMDGGAGSKITVTEWK